jgi:hypothetical protein
VQIRQERKGERRVENEGRTRGKRTIEQRGEIRKKRGKYLDIVFDA